MLRIYLTSRVRVENGEVLLDERDLPGRQGRLVAGLPGRRAHPPVSRDELGQELWGDDVPPPGRRG